MPHLNSSALQVVVNRIFGKCQEENFLLGFVTWQSVSSNSELTQYINNVIIIPVVTISV